MDYFQNKYGLTATHSEVVEAVEAHNITVGKALDLGCGRGRNAVYLKTKGFNVTAWDRSQDSIQSLKSIATAEGLSIETQVNDLEIHRFVGEYDFIVCTVVLMFLTPDAVPHVIQDMQAATAKGGYNLIVSAMDTEDYPCQLPFFSHTFKPGELSKYYDGWQLVKYNEDVGELHKTDAQGNRIKMRFATLLARKL